MVNSIIVDGNRDDIVSLENMISNNFPNIHIFGNADNLEIATEILAEVKPDILFMDIELPLKNGLILNEYIAKVSCQVILLTQGANYILDALNCVVCGYLIKPFREDVVVFAVQRALSKITENQEHLRNKFLAEEYFKLSYIEDVIGIPCFEGFEFVRIKDIICCEGMQKCTRVITSEKTDIISSYNLGEFRKSLEPYGFFSPHKSYLINLHLIRNYHREGNILMVNGVSVPVAKRKKGEFLNRIKHI
ncbi:MAG: LytTR family DNA-binding domain-containing protein [bacterium]